MGKEIVIVLDDIRSALNVGAILRTADGAGVKKIYLCGITPEANHPKVKKTALGAETFVTTIKKKNVLEAILELKADNYKIIAIEQNEKSDTITSIKNEKKLALIFGNELLGVSLAVQKASDKIIEIPMKGKKNSLNVATTAGIVLYYLILNE